MDEKIQIRALLYTAIICFGVFLLMLLYKITIEVKESVKFAEVVFVPPVEEQVQRVSRGSGFQGLGKSANAVRTVNLPKINLPSRFVLSEEEILLQKFAEKIDVIEREGEIKGLGLGVGNIGEL